MVFCQFFLKQKWKKIFIPKFSLLIERINKFAGKKKKRENYEEILMSKYLVILLLLASPDDFRFKENVCFAFQAIEPIPVS